MTVVDVNTGKFTGAGGNLEETVTKNNLEAAEEIVRQLRLRDIGGIIVVDFIDMVLETNRDLVLRRLLECLGRDRTKHQVAEVTSLGLVQMTRKRVGQGLLEVVQRDLRGLRRPRRSSCTTSRSRSARAASRAGARAAGGRRPTPTATPQDGRRRHGQRPRAAARATAPASGGDGRARRQRLGQRLRQRGHGSAPRVGQPPATRAAGSGREPPAPRLDLQPALTVRPADARLRARRRAGPRPV